MKVIIEIDDPDSPTNPGAAIEHILTILNGEYCWPENVPIKISCEEKVIVVKATEDGESLEQSE